MRLAVVGSANMDLVVTAGSLPRPGETVLGHSFSPVPGGKGLNQAVAAARAGASVQFIGSVGSDSFGAPLLSCLASADVDVSLVRTVAGSSGVALIAVDSAGENLIVVAPGANALLSLGSADLAAVAAADVLVAQLEVPLSAVAAAGRVARRFVLNAAPACSLPPELLSTVDLLVVNEGEAAALGPTLDAVPQVVVTLGAAGARCGSLTVPAPQVTAVDTTAAGDAFTAALAVAWGSGWPMVDALRWACAAGAACARRPGASASLPDQAEIDSLYREVYRADPA